MIPGGSALGWSRGVGLFEGIVLEGGMSDGDGLREHLLLCSRLRREKG